MAYRGEVRGAKVCPHCDAILTNHDVIGYEVRGVYDGVLFWVCKPCGKAFPRWDNGYMSEKAAPQIAEFNANDTWNKWKETDGQKADHA